LAAAAATTTTAVAEVASGARTYLIAHQSADLEPPRPPARDRQPGATHSPPPLISAGRQGRIYTRRPLAKYL